MDLTTIAVAKEISKRTAQEVVNDTITAKASTINTCTPIYNSAGSPYYVTSGISTWSTYSSDNNISNQNQSLSLPVVVGRLDGDDNALYFYDNYGHFEIGSKYKITINGFDIKALFTVQAVCTNKECKYIQIIHTIYDATFIAGPPRPDSGIKHVQFNESKGTTTVVWKDNSVTTVKCDWRDTFDKEKALAICFMKKYYKNRGCFNEILKEYCE